jgi:hypothetical protein
VVGTPEVKTGVLIVRIWADEAAPSGFRARIIETLDIAVPEEVLRGAGTSDEICEAVRDWLTRFVGTKP